jgi:WD40 repeat protein/DNA-binding SARP family transcriptional activator
MVDRLEIHTLGNLSIHHNGEIVKGLTSRKAKALLVYLATYPRSHPREILAEMFWDERSQSRTMANLRVVIASLNKHLGDYVDIDRDHVRINPHAEVWLDSTELARKLEESKQAGGALTPKGRDSFEQALSLYRGEFLEGFYLRDAPGFEAWQRSEQEGMHNLLVQGLRERVEECLQSGNYQLGLTLARRLLELEPLMEAAHHQTIRLLANSQHREAALEQYKLYAELLQSELGVEPTPSMQALYKQLLKGELAGKQTIEIEMAQEPPTVGACPYRGLAAFRETDVNFFFGRDTFKDQLYEKVQSQALVTVIVGPSGAGKSSIVYAGLLPRLREEDWLVIHFRPGSLPFSSLAGALMPHLEPDLSETERLVEQGKLVKAWRSGELGLIPVLERLAQKRQAAGRILLAADQFEELYTLSLESEEQRHFLNLLLDAFSENGWPRRSDPFGLLITLRADFMGQSLAHRPFADALQQGVLMLGPMNREELQAAIEKPAEMQGVAIEPGLVGRILDDVGEDPGNLPLLEFTLTLLWEHMEQGRMTHAAYETIGGVQGALARYADDVYSGLEEADQQHLKRIFIQLVQPGHGTEDTRRIGQKGDFEEKDWGLIWLLTDKRLLVTGQGDHGRKTVEVIHEALIQHWGRLQDWMAADREFRTWQEGLRVALRGWEASGSDSGALLRGVPLLNAEGWFAQRSQDLSPAEKGYLETSLAERDARQAKEKAQQDRERALERRSIHRLRLIVVVLVAASIIGITLTLAVLNQNQVARRNEALAFSRELAAAALNSQAEDQERAVLLAIQALAQADTGEAQEALHQTVGNFRLLRTLESPGRSGFIALSPDGGRLVSSDEDGAAVWDVNTGKVLYIIGAGTFINQAAFSPDGALLVTPNDIAGDSADKDTISILDAATGEKLIAFPAHDTGVQYVSFSPDGSQFATVGGDNHIKIWDMAQTLETGQAQSRLEISDDFGGFSWTVHFSPDGSRLVAAGYGEPENAGVWDAASGEKLFSFGSSSTAANAPIFSPDKAYLVSGSKSGTVDVWDASTGRLISRTQAHDGNMQCILFSPDGSRLATAGNDSVIKVWAFSEGVLQPLMTLTGHTDWVISLAFSPDGGQLFSGSVDGTVKIWDISPGGSIEPVIYPHTEQVNSVAFDPSGERLASASFDGTAKIWDTASGKLLHALSGHSGWVVCLAFSPDGALLATGGDDATVKLWEVSSGRELGTLRGHIHQEQDYFRGVRGLAFSPDGQRLATAGTDGYARVWDVASLQKGNLAIGDEILTLEGHTPGAWINDVVYNPDGSLLATSSDDGTIVINEAATGQSVWVLSLDPPRAIWRVSFSPNGLRLAAGGDKGMASIWALPQDSTGIPQKSLQIQVSQDFVTLPRFSSDGNQLAVAHSDGMGIWNAHTGELLERLPHPGSVFAAEYSPDGKRILTAGGDGLARLFYLDMDDLLSVVRTRLTRDLTPDECQKYMHMDTCAIE